MPRHAVLVGVCLVMTGLGSCTQEPPPPIPEPAPEPEPERAVLWFDAVDPAGQATPDVATRFDQVLAAALAEFPDFPTLARSPSHAQRWWETSFDIRVGGGKTRRSATTLRCAALVLSGLGVDDFDGFASSAERRKEKVRRSPQAIVWEAPRRRGEIVEAGTTAEIELCATLDAATGVDEIRAALRSDWRLTPAVELSGQISAEPVAVGFERERDSFIADAVFELRSDEQVDTTLEWLKARGLTTDAMRLRWRTTVGRAHLEVLASDWGAIPVRVEVKTRTVEAPG